MNYYDTYEAELERLQDDTADLVAFIESASTAATDVGMGDLAYDLDSLVDKVHSDNDAAAREWAEGRNGE